MQKSPMSTMLEITQKESDALAKLLGKKIRAHEESEKQLGLLTQYREDYLQRFESGASVGLTMAQFNNYHAFIQKLDSAVDGQKVLVKEAEKQINSVRKLWQESERKRLSYQTLENRAVSEQQKIELKRDQKQTDEHAARNFFYKS